MLGFGEAQEIAHAMEDVIQTAATSGALAAEMINPLLAAGDAIRAVVTGATGLAPEAVAATEGTAAVCAAGGLTMAQDEASSIVYGMPRAAAEHGANLILPLAGIGNALAGLRTAAGRP